MIKILFITHLVILEASFFHQAHGRQQIPFGFFRGLSSMTTILESFEGTWTSECTPLGWTGSGSCSSFGWKANEYATPTTEGSKSMGAQLSEGSYNTNISKSINLTGYSTITVDVLSRTTCTSLPACLQIQINSSFYNFCSTGNNQSTSISFSGSQTVRIRAINNPSDLSPGAQPDCEVIIDNLRFN